MSKQRHGIVRGGLTFRIAVTVILATITLTGLFRFFSFVSFSDQILSSAANSISTNSAPLSHREILLVGRIAALQTMLGRQMQAIPAAEIPVSDCELQLKVARSNHSGLLVEIVAQLDKILEILKSDSHSKSEIFTGNEQATAEAESYAEAEGEDDKYDGFSLDRSRRFESAELRAYTNPKPNRGGRRNFLGATTMEATVGLGCGGAARLEATHYMNYTPKARCPDDWPAAQRLINNGCDPPPRRRCFAAAPDRFNPSPTPWTLPQDDRTVRWTHYKCKNFRCLTGNDTGPKGFYKCADCFDLTGHERRRWMNGANNTAEFTIEQVLSLKPQGNIRIGLDFGPGTGTFAAVMKARNVTVVTATLNLGAPFNEMIALRGLIPLYLSVNQRLPFFDNTLDIIHTTLFFDGWVDVEFLEFVTFDWDRVLRPRGLLWIDRFFCADSDVAEYVAVFEKLKYNKLLWSVEPKLDKGTGEVFFSAVLEKSAKA